VFALPFADDFTLVGTTDENFVGALDSVAPSADEIMYLCRAVNEFFRARTDPNQVVWAFAGVRSLYDESAGKDTPEDVTRDYHLTLDEGQGTAPLLTVYGGKITTHRMLAEHALEQLSHFFQATAGWTAGSPLPGGDFPWDELAAQVARATQRWPFLTKDEASRMVRAYGTRIDRVLGEAKKREDIGPMFGPLSATEVRYLMAHEWARTADDVLWRRSKLGLKLSAAERETLAQFMAQNQAPAAAAAS
jgi:glycerol-3-phosphate dehydrogenase